MFGFYTRPHREINIIKIIFIVNFGNYSILAAIVAVNKKKDSFKVCKFHVAATKKMGISNLLHWFMHHTRKGLSDQRTATQHTSNAISATAVYPNFNPRHDEMALTTLPAPTLS